jgi:hypothetical protein
MSNRYQTQFFYTLHKKPVFIDCNFVVDETNGNGLGIRSLKGAGVSAVYMHTSATPAPGNPNPPAGYIVVELSDSYYRYFNGYSGFASPISGTPLTATTANSVYIITSLGTATPAQWQAVGLPADWTPALGQAFVATASGTIGGSATVEVIAATGSGCDHIEVVGDPNQSINQLQSGSPLHQIILACFNENAITQPAQNTVIGLQFYLSDSSVTVQGE